MTSRIMVESPSITASESADTWSTLDLIALPAREAGEFYRQLNREIDNLRNKVDVQLKDMIKTNEEDISGLNRQLVALKSGSKVKALTAATPSTAQSAHSMLKLTRSASSVKPLQVTTSTLTEPATNLSRYKNRKRYDSPPPILSEEDEEDEEDDDDEQVVENNSERNKKVFEDENGNDQTNEINYNSGVISECGSTSERSEMPRRHEQYDDVIIPQSASVKPPESKEDWDLMEGESEEEEELVVVETVNESNDISNDDYEELESSGRRSELSEYDLILRARRAKDQDSECAVLQKSIENKRSNISSNMKQMHLSRLDAFPKKPGSRVSKSFDHSYYSGSGAGPVKTKTFPNVAAEVVPQRDSHLINHRSARPTTSDSKHGRQNLEPRDTPQYKSSHSRPDAPVINDRNRLRPDAPSQQTSMRFVAGLPVVNGIDLKKVPSLYKDPSSDNSVCGVSIGQLQKAPSGVTNEVISSSLSNQRSINKPHRREGHTKGPRPRPETLQIRMDESQFKKELNSVKNEEIDVRKEMPKKADPPLPEDFTSSDWYDGEIITIEQVLNKTLIDPYGDRGKYTGVLIRDKPHGHGSMLYTDGRSYTGNWKYGRWHGSGRAKFSNGDSYIGQYNMDQRHGVGRYEWSDGRVYDGEFCRDQRQGAGTYTWPDGSVYTGEFFAGHRHGHGCYMFSNGSIYTGEWSEGKYHGIGECVWADGRMYRGEWVNGRAHGYGVEFRSDGSIRHDGEWKEDRPVKRSKEWKAAVASTEQVETLS